MTDPYQPLLFAQQLATKFCHDLAGPVGAVNNGVEFLTDQADPEMQKQAMDLLKLSADQAFARLQMYRVAYGLSNPGGVSSFEEVKNIIAKYLGHTKIGFHWIAPEPKAEWANVKMSSPVRQLLVHVILLFQSELIYGGQIEIRFRKEAGKAHVTVKGTAEKIKPSKEMEQLLKEGPGAALNEKNVQPVMMMMALSKIDCQFDYRVSEHEILCDIALNNI